MPIQASAAVHHNADVVTNALIWHLMVPCALWVIGIGVFVIAFEVLKGVILKEIKKLRAKSIKRPL